MLRIGEFAWLGCVSTHTLRHYDEMGLLKPAQIDPETGYRYYAPKQLPRLNRILMLKDLGLPLEQIVELFERDFSKNEIRDLLEQKRAEVQTEVEALKGRLDRIQLILDGIHEDMTMPDYDVRIKMVDTQKVASIRETISSYRQDVFGPALGRMFQTLGEHLQNQGTGYAGPGITIYHDSHGGSENTALDVEVAAPVQKDISESDDVKVRELPEQEVAYVVHHGNYGKLGFIKQDVMRWVYENGYQLAAPVREVYLHHDEKRDGTGESEHHVTEVQVPVVKV